MNVWLHQYYTCTSILNERSAAFDCSRALGNNAIGQQFLVSSKMNNAIAMECVIAPHSTQQSSAATPPTRLTRLRVLEAMSSGVRERLQRVWLYVQLWELVVCTAMGMKNWGGKGGVRRATKLHDTHAHPRLVRPRVFNDACA